MEVLQKKTFEAYLEGEYLAETKSEYMHGQIYAMAGASLNHNAIVANLMGELTLCLKKHSCRVFASDTLIEVVAEEVYFYPDVTIVCDDVRLRDKKERGLDVLLNPAIIIEVLSDSTELYDRSIKFEHYKTLTSLQEYVLVSSKKKQVEIYRCINENEWMIKLIKNPNEEIRIGECTIYLNDIYNKMNEIS